MSRIVAILTGDLIGSTAVPPEAVERSMRIIADCAGEIGQDTDFTRFRGDGWQIRLLRPGDCLWACLLILARLRAVDGALGCRIAIGIGEEYDTDASTLSTAMGPAFTASGRTLDQMKPDRLLALGSLPKPPDSFRQLATTVAATLAARWSVSQAEAMALKLDVDSPAGDRESNDRIARQLGITRQAVDARLKAADYPILNDAIEAFLQAYNGEAKHA